jgi:hypothetical protein
MELRRHPSMRFGGLGNWPPVWVRLGRANAIRAKSLRAEIGNLQEVRRYENRPGKLYLTINYRGAGYVGCLIFDDHSFCERAFEHLRRCCGMEIETVGDLELLD